MNKCIYCLKTESETVFEGEEHIIPKSLGGETFPTISKEFICSNCNSVILSGLETEFKRDSLEGVYAQMLGIGGADSVWITGKNINMDTISGFGDKFFDEMFPFLKFENNTLVIALEGQLKVNNKINGFQVFPLTTLQNALHTESKRKFNKIKERLAKVSMDDIVLFEGSKDGTHKSIDNFIELLKEYGINFQEKERRYIPIDHIKDNKFEIGWKCKIESNLIRVIAKIAFNYFAYCSIQEGKYYQELLMGMHFDKIRNFIYKDVGNWKDFVNVSKKQAILNIEEGGNKRILAHTILFENNNGIIMAKVSLFGRWIYEVAIGKYPLKLIQNNFGCGHLFEPFEKSTHAIGPDPFSFNRIVDKGFGWFKV